MRTLTALLLALLLALSGAALAETPATPIRDCGDYTYILLEDGTAQIVAWQGENRALAVPATLDGLRVSSISECAFADSTSLVRVTLPEGVREIGEECFAGCEALGEVGLPEGLERIGDRAFEGCEALTAIALPASVRSIGENPFAACDNLCDVAVAADSACLEVVDGVLFSRDDGRLVCHPMGLCAERYAVPEGVTIIGAMAFSRDLCLETVELPASLVRIERRAFDGCDGLKSMNLPAGVTFIGEDAMRCSSLVLTHDGEGAPQLALAGEGA